MSVPSPVAGSSAAPRVPAGLLVFVSSGAGLGAWRVPACGLPGLAPGAEGCSPSLDGAACAISCPRSSTRRCACADAAAAPGGVVGASGCVEGGAREGGSAGALGGEDCDGSGAGDICASAVEASADTGAACSLAWASTISSTASLPRRCCIRRAHSARRRAPVGCASLLKGTGLVLVGAGSSFCGCATEGRGAVITSGSSITITVDFWPAISRLYPRSRNRS